MQGDSQLPAGVLPERWRKQRNQFYVGAICGVASLLLVVPGRIRKYRELKAVNAQLVDLQHAIDSHQRLIRAVQADLIQTQQQIKARLR